jgi:hypothetical protein
MYWGEYLELTKERGPTGRRCVMPNRRRRVTWGNTTSQLCKLKAQVKHRLKVVFGDDSELQRRAALPSYDTKSWTGTAALRRCLDF